MEIKRDDRARSGQQIGQGRHPPRRCTQGRRPQEEGLSAPTSLSELELRALLAEPAPDEIDGVAQKHADLAIETLARLLIYGASESAKITAAKEILDRGYGKPAVEIGGDAAMLPFMMAPAAARRPSATTSAPRRAAMPRSPSRCCARSPRTA
jgi:hypothetical protein